MPRISSQPAFVLHGRPYRESSLLLEALTRDHGRVAMVARGVQRGKSRLRNLLQPFRPLLLSWSAKGELGTLTGAEQVAAPPALQGDALFCGLYINELAMRFLHRGDPHPEVFERYRQAVVELASGLSLQPVLRVFEKHLLEAVGYGLSLDREPGNDQPISAEAWYDYRPGVGPVRLARDSAGKGGAVSGAALLALRDERLAAEHLPPLRRLMRRVIAHHAGDRPLVSSALFLGRTRQGTREPG